MDINYYKKYEPLFGSWKLVKEIGEGSFGQVYEIERQDFGRTYKAALKAITIPQSQSEIEAVRDDGMDDASITAYYKSFVAELVDEFAIMSKLKGDSNVVSYEDHNVIRHQDGIGWDILIRMELLTPLPKYLKEHPLSQGDVIRMGCDICRALELCGKHNIIHRDIKPENIFVSENGNYKLGDFGVAKTVEKTSSSLSKKGTYTYMAPEVYRGEPYGADVDLYSLGIVLYKLLNDNRAPFLPAYPEPITHSNRESALMRRIGGETIPAPRNSSQTLSGVVLKACAFDPGKRYTSPAQMREELEKLLDSSAEGAIVLDRSEDTASGSASYTGATEKTVQNPCYAAAAGASELFSAVPEDRDWRDMGVTACNGEFDQFGENFDKTEMLNQEDFDDSDETVSVRPDPVKPPVTPAKEPAKTGPKHAGKSGENKTKKMLVIGALAALAIIAAVAIIVVAGKGKTTPPPAETQEIAVTGIDLPEIMVLQIGDPIDVSAAVEPEGVTVENLEITTDKSNVLSTDASSAQGLAEGKAELTVNADGCQAKSTVFVMHHACPNVSSQPVEDCGWFYRVGTDGAAGSVFYVGDKLYWLDSTTVAEQAQMTRLGQIATQKLGKWSANNSQKKPWLEVFSDGAKTKSMGQLAIAVGPDDKAYVVIHTGPMNESPEKVEVIEYTDSSGYTYTPAKKNPAAPGAVQSVTLNRSYFDTTTVGSGVQLSATVNPATATNKTVSWSSSNSKVATVSSSGYVQTVGIGRATITASCGGRSASCSVCVDAPSGTKNAEKPYYYYW